MARHRQPLELAILKGQTKRHPSRYPGTVPKSPRDLGEPPAHLSEGAVAAWEELASLSLPGVLTGSDRFILEITASLLAEQRSDPAKFLAAKYGTLIGCLARLGLSPSDRQKLGTQFEAQSNPFDQF